MKYLCVTIIFLLAVLFSPKAACASAWLYWLVRAVTLLWAIWLQRRILATEPPSPQRRGENQ